MDEILKQTRPRPLKRSVEFCHPALILSARRRLAARPTKVPSGSSSSNCPVTQRSMQLPCTAPWGMLTSTPTRKSAGKPCSSLRGGEASLLRHSSLRLRRLGEEKTQKKKKKYLPPPPQRAGEVE